MLRVRQTRNHLSQGVIKRGAQILQPAERNIAATRFHLGKKPRAQTRFPRELFPRKFALPPELFDPLPELFQNQHLKKYNAYYGA